MTFVYNHKGKEIAAEFFIGVLVLVVIRSSLIERQVHFKGFVDFFLLLDDRHHVFEMPEVISLRLIQEDITISEEKNPFLDSVLPKAVDNLTGRIGLTCARRHNKQNTVLTVSDFFDGSVYCYLLIIPGRFS